jgi:ribonucleoside-diphosphate reductase alpha chain
MLTMLFETGHPWITFKDACNVRSPQQHAGVVHSSNLCTEIAQHQRHRNRRLQPRFRELLQHEGRQGRPGQLKKTIATAMRMLDNVIDINYYAVKKARLEPAPPSIGLGLMGFQDRSTSCAFPTPRRKPQFADESMEPSATTPTGPRPTSPRNAASTRATRARWGQGSFDRHARPAREGPRRLPVEVDRSAFRLGRAAPEDQGRRHAQLQLRAIAPTTTISNIIGVDASIEPCFAISVKSNLSGGSP